MVSSGTIVLLVGAGLVFFFREDIGQFLSGFKGFGERAGTVQVNVPEGFGEPTEQGFFQDFLDTLFGKGAGAGTFQAGQEAGVATQEFFEQAGIEAGKVGTQIQTSIVEAGVETQKALEPVTTIFTKPEESVLSPVFEAGQETAKIFQDPAESVLAPVFEAGQQTNILVQDFAENSTQFFQDISESFGSLFGGQQEPKAILTQETATTEKQTTPLLGTSVINPESLTGGFLDPIEPDTRFSGTGSLR